MAWPQGISLCISLCHLQPWAQNVNEPWTCLSVKVFQSISKDIMQRLATTQDQPSAGGQKANTIRVGDKPGGVAGKKAACCSS